MSLKKRKGKKILKPWANLKDYIEQNYGICRKICDLNMHFQFLPEYFYIVLPHNSLKNVNHFFLSNQVPWKILEINQRVSVSICLSVCLSTYKHTHTYIQSLISSTCTNNKNISIIPLLKLWNYGSSVMI